MTVAQLQTSAGGQVQLIDVRSASEYAAGHIPGAVNIALEEIETRLADLNRSSPLVLICQSGKRARMAAALLQPCGLEVSVLEGGTNAWIGDGLSVVSSIKTRWAMERQVRLGAGLLVLTGALLALTLDMRWVLLSAFVGLGLTFAGVTDFCPMAILLGKMPWNGRSRCTLTSSSPEVCRKSGDHEHIVSGETMTK